MDYFICTKSGLTEHTPHAKISTRVSLIHGSHHASATVHGDMDEALSLSHYYFVINIGRSIHGTKERQWGKTELL